jgi:stage II sporulation protein M
LRRIYRKTQFEKSTKLIISFMIILTLSITFGVYLNKLYPQAQQSMAENINSTVDFYNNNINISSVLLSNFKSDLIFTSSIYLSTVFLVTFPIAFIAVILKGISIGYTINTFILAFQLDASKIVSLTLFKNIILIPGSFILLLFSLNYLMEAYEIYKSNNKEKMKFITKKYTLSSVMLIAAIIIVQALVNAISIGAMQILL